MPSAGVAIASAESEYGATGCLINNAGMIHIGGLDSRSLEQINEEVDTMIKGVTHGIHPADHALINVNAKPHSREQGFVEQRFHRRVT